MSKQKTVVSWTPANVERLRRYLLEGKSTRQIEALTGWPYNACIGKASREWGSIAALRGSADPLPEPAHPIDPEREREAWRWEKKYATFRNRAKTSATCTAPGCRLPKQTNMYGLCATHDQERIRSRVTV